jgi:hypothetical protein
VTSAGTIDIVLDHHVGALRRNAAADAAPA